MTQSLSTFFKNSTTRINKFLAITYLGLFLVTYITSYFSIKNSEYANYARTLGGNFIHLIELGDIYQLEREIHSFREGANLAKVKIQFDGIEIKSENPNFKDTIKNDDIFKVEKGLYFLAKNTFELKTNSNLKVYFYIYDSINILNILLLMFLFFLPLGLALYFSSKKYSALTLAIIKAIKRVSFISNFSESDQKFSEIEELNKKLNEVHDLKIHLEKMKMQIYYSDLSTQVAHDIRSPICALNACLPFIEDTSKAKNLIKKSIQRIQEIADNLLNEHKITNTIKSAELIPLDLSIINLVEEKMVTHPEIKFNLNATESIYIKSEQKVDLERIISNLLQNSIEAITSDHGIIEISIAQNKIKIKDNGQGISLENLNKIFNKGFSFGKKNGNGLGLSGAKEYLSTIGAKIAVQSLLKIGTEVIIELPPSHEATNGKNIETR